MQKDTFEKAIEINKEIHDRKANVAKIKILKDNLIKSNCDLTDEEILIEFEADKIYFDGSDFFQVLDFLIELNEQKITQLEVLFNSIQDEEQTEFNPINYLEKYYSYSKNHMTAEELQKVKSFTTAKEINQYMKSIIL